MIPSVDEVFTVDEQHERAVQRAVEMERVKHDARRRLRLEDGGTTAPPPLITLHDRLSSPRVRTAWRIEGWQPQGARVMLPAQFKSGKTTLKGNVIRSLVDGAPFLGKYAVTPIDGVVIDLDFEMSQSQHLDWLEAQGIRHTDRVIPLSLRGSAAAFDIMDPVVRRDWAQKFKSVRCRYPILDCVRPVLDALGLDEHRDAGRFLVAFDALLAEAGAPEALVVHHMGHLGERSRGDSRLRDWPDVEWRLLRQTEDPASARFLTAFGRDVDIPEIQLAFDAQSRHLTVAGLGSRRDAKCAEILMSVASLLRDTGRALNGREIKAALQDAGHSRDSVDEALHYGVRNGLLGTETGPHNSRLYSPKYDFPALSGQFPADGACSSVRVSGRLYSAGNSGHSAREDADAERF